MHSTDSPQPSRFVIGLDLGTTNSAMAFVDSTDQQRRIQTFLVPQIVAPGVVESLETLPSFHYQPGSGEFSPESLHLPWGDNGERIVGQFARDHGTLVPGRLISSAKSWLCHNGVDRTADLLPWQGAEDVERLSPVAVSARYLEHYRRAWDHRFPDFPLAEQDFVLTIPASFDEVARELTIKAAKQAGLSRVVLIEEPQAAFYAWIDKNSQNWNELVTAGQTILVCDVGGGTSDFTLIRVRSDRDGLIQFHRVAVGDHLILGGDNFDLALAHHLEHRLKPGGQLEPRQWSVLVRSCRQLKEILLGDNPPATTTLTLPGSGSRLIGGSIQIPVGREEVETLLLEGFFPQVPLETRPSATKSGFQEFGLPYAPDPGITKYLASFLTTHRFTDGEQPATEMEPSLAVLFNGGVFASPLFRDRLIHSLENWFRRPGSNWTPTVLDNDRLDLAVARGAAYYGMVRRGQGVRINAGLARTYYIGVDNAARSSASATETMAKDDPAGTEQKLAPSALCLLPAGIEPGHEVDLSQHQFELLISQPIEFPLYVSSTRLTDQPGELVTIDSEQIKALPPIRTVLKTGKSKEAATVSVILKARLTEIGTLDLWCSEVDGKRTWKLLFDVRSTTQTDLSAHDAAGERQGMFDDEVLQSVRSVITTTFGAASRETPPRTTDPAVSGSTAESRKVAVATVVRRLVEMVKLDREEWPTSLLRQIWEALIDQESGRKESPEHEARWLNLVGYALRPGYGLALDDWRCHETWKLLQGKLVHATTAGRAEWYILWRRVAGGLTAGQQQALTAPLLSQMKQAIRNPGSRSKSSEFGTNTHESAELVRLLGACELLPVAVKCELGDLLLELLERPRFRPLTAAAYWSVGRIGARRPVYGPLNTVVPADVAARWLRLLAKLDLTDHLAAFAAMQLARKTGDRYRDIDESTRSSLLQDLKRAGAPSHYSDLIREVKNLESDEQNLVLGDSLPKGLRIL